MYNLNQPTIFGYAITPWLIVWIIAVLGVIAFLISIVMHFSKRELKEKTMIENAAKNNKSIPVKNIEIPDYESIEIGATESNFGDSTEGLVTNAFIDNTEGFVDKTEGFIDKTEGFIDKTEGFIDKTEGFENTESFITYREGIKVSDKTESFIEKTEGLILQQDKTEGFTSSLPGISDNKKSNFCSQCGSKVSGNFCSRCGYKIN